jgi:sporulation protein YlmC with PRC-barrel domain
MATPPTATLEKLGDANLTVKDPNEDIRGRKVLDKNGDDAGTVEDLLIDTQERKVRLMEVGSGGFLGIGESTVLIPIDAITRITDDAVHINQTREHVVGAPRYDPALANDQQYWGGIYNYYGYGPFWGVGYTYPGYPYFC